MHAARNPYGDDAGREDFLRGLQLDGLVEQGLGVGRFLSADSQLRLRVRNQRRERRALRVLDTSSNKFRVVSNVCAQAGGKSEGTPKRDGHIAKGGRGKGDSAGEDPEQHGLILLRVVTDKGRLLLEQ